jgi:hypothetical protein
MLVHPDHDATADLFGVRRPGIRHPFHRSRRQRPAGRYGAVLAGLALPVQTRYSD